MQMLLKIMIFKSNFTIHKYFNFLGDTSSYIKFQNQIKTKSFLEFMYIVYVLKKIKFI